MLSKGQTSILPSGVKAIAILFGILALYWQDLTIVADEALQSESASHILVIPLLLGYLIYRKRKVLRAIIPSESSKPMAKDILHREADRSIVVL